MPSKTISESAKRACVLRVAAARKAGNNIVPGEASRLKVSVQAVRNWCREAGVDLKGGMAPPPVVPVEAPEGNKSPPDPSPANPAGEPAAADALADAHKIAGTETAPAPAAGSLASITPQEVERAFVEASAEDKAFVVDTLEDFKKMAVGFAGPIIFKVPQEDPALVKLSQFGPMTRNVLRANAGIIAPDMRKTIARGWDIVIGALVMDLSFTAAALAERRKELKPKREEVEERPARVKEPAAEEKPAPARPGDVWKPDGSVPPPPPAGAVVPR